MDNNIIDFNKARLKILLKKEELLNWIKSKTPEEIINLCYIPEGKGDILIAWQERMRKLLAHHVKHVNVPNNPRIWGEFPLVYIGWAEIKDKEPVTIISGKKDALKYLQDQVPPTYTATLIDSVLYPGYYDLYIYK